MTTQQLKNVEIVHLGIRIWTGTKKLEVSDLNKINHSLLPSSEVASLGTKKVINPEHLKPFSKIRHRAEEACRKVGVRFLGSFAIPETAVPDLLVVFDDLRTQFERELDNFIQNYDDWVDSWAQEHPEFSTQIRSAQMPHDWLRSRFCAKFATFRITASEHERDDFIEDQQEDLFESVISSIHDELEDYVLKVRDPRNDGFRVTVRGSVLEIAQKLRRFSFLDSSGGMTAFAAQLEHSVQGNGKIQGDDYSRFRSLISDLVDLDAVKARLLSLGGGVSSVSELAEPVHSDLDLDLDLDLDFEPDGVQLQKTVSFDLDLDLGTADPVGSSEDKTVSGISDFSW